MLISVLTWYLVLQFLALVGLPLAFATLRRLPSRGYATAKALGLLLTGVVFWWGGILHLWQNTRGGVLAATLVVLGSGLWLMRGQWQQVGPWWRRHRRHVLIVELLFLGGLILWSLVRATQPQLQTAGGEKWMEIAFLNATLRARFMPPHDPWLSGFAISYYYLGYLLMGILSRLSLISSTITFNLSNAGWFALVAIQAYGLVYDMTEGRRPLRSLIAPVMLLITGNGEGLLEVFHARGLFSPEFWAWLDIGRLSEPPQPPYSWIPQRFFWWWQASRTLRDRTPWGDVQEVIDEFPAFSFILGDMHPHLLALPFVLVAVAFALNAYRLATEDRSIIGSARATWDLRAQWAALRPRLAPLTGYALILGTLGFLNTWDFPIYWALLVGAWVLGRYARAEKSVDALFSTVLQVLPEAFVLGVLSVALYFPFWLALRSQAGGVLPNLFNATKIQHFVVMFLPLIVPVIGVIVGRARASRVRWYSAVGVGVALMVAIAVLALLIGAATAYPYLMAILRQESVEGYTLPPETALSAVQRRLAHPWVGLILAVGVGAALLTLIKGPSTREHEGLEAHPDVESAPVDEEVEGTPDRFPLLLVLLGLLLTLAPEFIYLKDVFMTRMNTIFKFYFQAWILWSLAGSWQLVCWLDAKPRARSRDRERAGWRWVGVGVSMLFIAVGLVYTALAVPARAEEQGYPWTLDGASWVEQMHPADAVAIAWLNANVSGAPVIVEAPGDQHRAYVYEGRVSALTGLPTILGWGGHQRQWRGNYDEPALRELDLEQLFTTLDQALTRTILRRYDVAYVYIGPTERQRYPASGLAKFDDMFPAVYTSDEVTIYRVLSAAPVVR
ncbi:MAG: DUF2298 domain-containing protein [Anaerolineae bacterium]